jgi:hypothetical protein
VGIQLVVVNAVQRHVARYAGGIPVIGIIHKVLLWVGGVFRIWSRPLLQGSGLLSVDKRDSEPGPAVCIEASPVRRSGSPLRSGSCWLLSTRPMVRTFDRADTAIYMESNLAPMYDHE